MGHTHACTEGQVPLLVFYKHLLMYTGDMAIYEVDSLNASDLQRFRVYQDAGRAALYEIVR